MMVNGGTIPTSNDYKINGLEKYGSKGSTLWVYFHFLNILICFLCR